MTSACCRKWTKLFYKWCWMLLLSSSCVVGMKPPGSLCKRLYEYKMVDHGICVTCAICPDNYKKHPMLVQPECEEYAPKLPDGRVAHCRGRSSQLPSCPKWNDTHGKVTCMGKVDFVVYSNCSLVCDPGYIISFNTTVSCTEDNLQWSEKVLPKCIKQHFDEEITSKPGGDSTSVPRGVWEFLAFFGVVFVMIFVICVVKACLRCGENLHTSNQRIQSSSGNVSELSDGEYGVTLALLNARDLGFEEWSVDEGESIDICALCPCLNTSCDHIKYIVVLKSMKPNSSEKQESKVYTSIPLGPSKITIASVGPNDEGDYFWIAHVQDGQKKKGTFKVFVKARVDTITNTEPARYEVISEAAVSHTEEADVTDSVFAENESLIPSPTTERRQLSAAEEDGDSGQQSRFQRVLKSKQAMKKLCHCFDHNEDTEYVTWHDIAMSALLRYERDVIMFFEYHLKGKLYQGPTFHIFTLMLQQGISLQQLVTYLEESRDRSPPGAVGILKEFLD